MRHSGDKEIYHGYCGNEVIYTIWVGWQPHDHSGSKLESKSKNKLANSVGNNVKIVLLDHYLNVGVEVCKSQIDIFDSMSSMIVIFRTIRRKNSRHLGGNSKD